MASALLLTSLLPLIPPLLSITRIEYEPPSLPGLPWASAQCGHLDTWSPTPGHDRTDSLFTEDVEVWFDGTEKCKEWKIIGGKLVCPCQGGDPSGDPRRERCEVRSYCDDRFWKRIQSLSGPKWI